MDAISADTPDMMQSLMGRSLVDWGRDDSMFHLRLDDGRVLIFIAMAILLPEEHSVH